MGRDVQVAHWTVSASKFPVIRFTTAPARMDPRKITAIYANVARLPMRDAIVVIDTALMAGPVIRNTNAAPGDRPFIISAVAIGIAAVEQMYIGNPMSAIIGIAR
jgi:hypothetical protein